MPTLINLKSKFCLFILFVSTLILSACGGSGGGSPTPSNYTLGTLPNGSTVYVSSSSFTAASDGSTTGTLGISGGITGQSYTFTFSVSPSGPTVTSAPNPCTIISGSGNTCQLTFAGNSVAAGTYTVTTFYTALTGNSKITIASESPLENTIDFIVTGGSGPIPGTLVISPLTESRITIGATTTATVTLSDSQGITTPVEVNLTSSNTGIMSESPASCQLSSNSSSCLITLTGESAGSATFTASAESYASVTSSALAIYHQQYAYFTNDSGTAYWQCSLVNNIIEISSCVLITPTGNGVLNYPYGITISNGFAYFANYDGNSYTQCSLGNMGIESFTCVTTGYLNAPAGVAVDNGFIYFSSARNGSYTQCAVGNNGVESSSCTTIFPTGNTLSRSFGVTISNGFAYFTDIDESSYTQCNVGVNGIESLSCVLITPTGNGTLNKPAGVVVSNGFAYFVNSGNNSYTQCNVGVSGIESVSCNTITPMENGADALRGPFGAAINNGIFYFANYNGNTYTRCNVGIIGIESSSCTSSIPFPGDDLYTPVEVAIY